MEKLGELNCGGEKIEIYPEFLLWRLKKGLYLKAGLKYWKKKVMWGKASPGVSLNLKIWNILKSTDRDFIIHDIQKDTYYKLNKNEAIKEAVDITQKRVPLKLVPIYCSKTVDLNNL